MGSQVESRHPSGHIGAQGVEIAQALKASRLDYMTGVQEKTRLSGAARSSVGESLSDRVAARVCCADGRSVGSPFHAAKSARSNSDALRTKRLRPLLWGGPAA